MRRAHLHACLSVGALTLIGFAPPTDSPQSRQCVEGVCTVRLTPLQLLRNAEKAARDRQFGAAKAMLAALAQAPELKVERSFLNGYVAAETGDLPQAAQFFRAVLRDRPDIVRARLELARVLMLQGKDSAADHHFRLAEEAKDLPPEIAQTIRGARGVIRQRKPWYINVNAGLAPDSNVNNATDAETIDVPFGSETLPLKLDEDARRKSGTGQFATVSAGVRLRLSDGLAMVVDADGSVINQRGTAADDVSALLAAGPELTMTNGARIGIQATGVQRWYGGRSATTGGGIRLSYQQNLDAGARIGLQVESRRIESGFGDMYGGWQHSAYGTYERVVRTSMIASAGLFVRRDDLRSEAFSNTEFGTTLGIGGELPHGINAGLSGGISRAVFDAPYLSRDPRHDWRFNARAYVGARSLRLLGFSPSVTYTFNRTDSNVALYEMSRHRFAFGLARYF